MPLVFSEPRRVWLAAMDDNESYVKCYSLAQIGMGGWGAGGRDGAGRRGRRRLQKA
jgi:hypothetical protein